ncbi:hypothetical protein TH66_16085 [Carbonactinospora thermoautotrophica]|uniref:Secreted protein n=1 Tax=Carbonactinospora thermoautotrophica TaxID=1469144 RepID=A0A132MR85_9ACTN|nr:DUF3093 domain-containing protein [Carbonactinospora thermoautotrophica]KWX00341.1 hypothetical protein TH66_16085 [Carbonactinospora thermoautotrophica]KWX01566.1 Secreted protein [Carbonactinospora thermoautotrophica]KWX10785.1 hypothetical protein TR74_01550 [Carbonactinospora thermoautotrophica]
MRYSERLTVPWRWWVVLVFFLASLWVAYAAWLGPGVALLVTGAAALITAGVLVGYGSARIRVADGVLEAGRAAIPLSAVGTVRALTAEEARELRGPKADPRAYLLLRGYLPRAVYVEVADPADPTPYWYVSTRRPDELAAALNSAKAHAR